MPYLTVSEAANVLEHEYQLACAPRLLSDLLYTRRLDVRRCPIQCGRRMVPRDYLPAIAKMLRMKARGNREAIM